MGIFWLYYLSLAAVVLLLIAALITKATILFVLVGVIWLFYQNLHCPQCKASLKRNRTAWWRLPTRTCLKCGCDLANP